MPRSVSWACCFEVCWASPGPHAMLRRVVCDEVRGYSSSWEGKAKRLTPSRKLQLLNCLAFWWLWMFTVRVHLPHLTWGCQRSSSCSDFSCLDMTRSRRERKLSCVVRLSRDQRARPGGRARVEGGVGPTCLLGKGCKSSNRMNHPLLDLNATPAPCPSPSCLASCFAMTWEPSVLVEPPSDWRLNHPNQHFTRNQRSLSLLQVGPTLWRLWWDGSLPTRETR